MRVISLVVCYVILWPGLCRAQTPALAAYSQADWRTMMDSLHLDTLRPYVDGMNPHAAHVPNYDEALANPYPDLPDPLTLRNGVRVTNTKAWWALRRPQIVQDFDHEVYGITPSRIPAVHWVVTSVVDTINGSTPVRVKHLKGVVDNSSFPEDTVNIDLTLTTPESAKTPVPVMMELAFVVPPGFRLDTTRKDSTWQQRVLAKGWGYAVIIPTSIQADNGAGLTRGIIGLVNQGRRRSPTDWGALKAWAWGVSKAIDYFQTDRDVDAHQIGIEGHSRYGKAALVAMAYDPRIAIAYISSSGEGGAKLSRRNYGEVVENLASSGEYHWMGGNFLKYAGPLHWNDLPVDAHELIALCAPRPVFISGGSKGDAWVDIRGMYMAAVAAIPVYTLLGHRGLLVSGQPATFGGMPPAGTPLIDGDLAFAQHLGGHTPNPNWPVFLAFASRYFTIK
jgi:hypothetical protein